MTALPAKQSVYETSLHLAKPNYRTGTSHGQSYSLFVYYLTPAAKQVSNVDEGLLIRVVLFRNWRLDRSCQLNDLT